MQVAINADMGESFGHYQIGNDDALMQYLSSVNLACGFHAGDPVVMRHSVETAAKYGVSIGAHPGLPGQAGLWPPDAGRQRKRPVLRPDLPVWLPWTPLSSARACG